MENFYKRVSMAQAELKAPKSNYNSFGKYKYRSCEDILEAAKPICNKHSLVLNLSDHVELVGNRYYVTATATLFDTESDAFMVSTGCAREEETKKGMDGSQITGTASSYARKYALNGLFNIDDTKDADTDEFHKTTNSASELPPIKKATPIAEKPPMFLCKDCNKLIEPTKKRDGSVWDAGEIATYSQGRFGRVLCPDCMKKAQKNEAAK